MRAILELMIIATIVLLVTLLSYTSGSFWARLYNKHQEVRILEK